MVLAVFDAQVMIESEANILPFRWQQILYADDLYHPYDPHHHKSHMNDGPILFKF